MNPATYGAVCDGVTNDYAAFASAVAAGNVYVPVIGSGTCLINPPSNGAVLVQGRTIQCASGVTLRTTLQDTSNTAIFRFEGPGNSNVNHCVFEGANNITTPTFNASEQANMLVEDWCTAAQGGACNLVLDSNTFEGCTGNACVSVFGNDSTGPVVGGSITNNIFKGCGSYGVALVSATNWTVSGNDLTDCAAAIEDDLGQQNNHNTVDRNTLHLVNDIGWKPSNGGMHDFLTCGQAVSGFDYGTNVCSNNSLFGTNIQLDEGGVTTPYVATYTNNLCGGVLCSGSEITHN